MLIIVNSEGGQFGPFDLESLQAYVEAGSVNLTDYCLADSWSEWRMVATLVRRLPATEPKDQDHRKETRLIGGVAANSLTSVRTAPSTPRALSIPGAIGVQRLTNMATFGLVVSPETGSGAGSSASPSETQACIHLARGPEKLGVFSLRETTEKLATGELMPSDWWFDLQNNDWRPLSSLCLADQEANQGAIAGE